MCGKPAQTKEASMRNKDQILIVSKIAIHHLKSASVIMLNHKNRVFFFKSLKNLSKQVFFLRWKTLR